MTHRGDVWALLVGKLSWQVFDAEIIIVQKDKASPLSLGWGQGCLSNRVSGIEFKFQAA